MHLRNTRRYLLGVASLVLALAAGAAWWWAAPHGRAVVFVVPAGTSARLAAGEDIQVLPATIRLRRNDTLVIRNDDSAALQVGPFPIAPGQRFVQRYPSPGTYDLLCSIHQGERMRVLVE